MAEPGGYESAGLRKAHITLNNEQVKALPTTPIEAVVVSQENSFLFVQKAFCHANIQAKYLLSDDSPVTNDSLITLAWNPETPEISCISNQISGGQIPIVPTEWAWILDDNRIADGANPDILRGRSVWIVAVSENGQNFGGGHVNNYLVFEVYFAEVSLALPPLSEVAEPEPEPEPEPSPMAYVFIGQSSPPLLTSFCAMESSDQQNPGAIYFSNISSDFTTDNTAQFETIVNGSTLRIEQDQDKWNEYICTESAVIDSGITINNSFVGNSGQPIDVNASVTVSITAPTLLASKQKQRRK